MKVDMPVLCSHISFYMVQPIDKSSYALMKDKLFAYIFYFKGRLY